MEKTQLVEELKAFSEEMKQLSIDTKNSGVSLYMGDTKVIQAKILPEILSSNWIGITNEAEQGLAQAETTMAGLRERQVRINQVSLHGEIVIGGLKQHFIPVLKRKEWPETKALLVEKLLTSGHSQPKINAQIARIEKYNNSQFALNTRKPTFLSESNLNDKYEMAFAHYMGNLLAFYASRFNTLVDTGKSNNADIDTYRQATQIALDERLMEVFDALKSKDLKEAGLKGDSLANYCLGELNETAVELAATIYIKRKNGKGDFTIDGQKASNLGDLLRSLLLNVAIGRYVQWVGGYHAKFHISKQFLTKASKLKIANLPAIPPSVKIADLAADPLANDGKSITIEGRVKNVSIVHRGRKAISNAEVEDDKGNSVLIAMPYIKLDSGGIVPGAYLSVAGVWIAINKEASGKPALDIDRVDYTGLSKTNWKGWLTLQMRNIFEPVPHTLNASYSWEAGQTGAISSNRYSTFNIHAKN